VKLWRVVGFDDSFKGKLAYLVGCVTCRDYVEGFLIDRIEVDGFDVSERIVSLIKSSRFHKQIRCILLSGITFAGFNIADLEYIYESLNIPIVVVMDKYPSFERIERALKNLDNPDFRIELIRKAGDVKKVSDTFVQAYACDLEFVERILDLTVKRGKIPEPLRIAHLVASALIHGESKRR